MNDTLHACGEISCIVLSSPYILQKKRCGNFSFFLILCSPRRNWPCFEISNKTQFKLWKHTQRHSMLLFSLPQKGIVGHFWDICLFDILPSVKITSSICRGGIYLGKSGNIICRNTAARSKSPAFKTTIKSVFIIRKVWLKYQQLKEWFFRVDPVSVYSIGDCL